jgi:hypothetical protein
MLTEDEEAAILQEATMGRPVREIARAHKTTIAEVHRVLDLEAEKLFSAAGTRRQMLIEAERLSVLKTMLWTRAVQDNDLEAAMVLCKVSARISSMLGWNHPNGHVVTLTSTLPPTEEPMTTTRKMLLAVQALRDQYEKPVEQNEKPVDTIVETEMNDEDDRPDTLN